MYTTAAICRLTRVLLLALATMASAGALGQEPKQPVSEDAIPRVWIYRDVPAPGQEDTRSAPERHFTPYLYMPEKGANRISVNVRMPCAELDSEEKGTCVEFLFAMSGVNDWLSAGFIPGGRPGDRPPRNVIDSDHFVVGFGRPVFLRFRARTAKGQTANVGFESGGFADGEIKDGIRPAETPKEQPTRLTDKWAQISIDLTKKAGGLNSVASPLRVVVRANENAGRGEILVYVDDVRFEIGEPVKEKDKRSGE